MQRHLPLVGLIFGYIIYRSQTWEVDQYWDGAAYYKALLTATRLPFDLIHFTVDGHTSQAFFLLMSIPLYLLGDTVYFFNLWLTLFCASALLPFYAIVRLLIPTLRGRFEAVLVTALFALHPSVIASMTQFNVDTGMTVFALWLWWALLEARRGVACLLGLCFVLSKEPAIAFLPILFFGAAFIQQQSPPRSFLNRNLRVLTISYATFLALLLYKITRGEPSLWTGFPSHNGRHIIAHMFDWCGDLYGFFATIFLINGNWIIWLLIVLFSLRFVADRELRDEPPFGRNTVMVALVFSSCFMIMWASWVGMIVRYSLFLMPLIVLLFAMLTSVAIRQARARIVLLLLLLCGMCAQHWHTVDPLSKRYFGTFTFSSYPMLWIMKSSRYPLPYYGRDQLVYNLQFVGFPKLEQVFLSRIPSDAIITAPESILWFTFNSLSRPKDSSHSPSNISLISTEALLGKNTLPVEIYYPHQPFSKPDPLFESLQARYQMNTVQIYEHDGYSLAVSHLSEPKNDTTE